ncbi:T cell receptor alpha chain MC.7.G5-like [Acanthochromis polyacanthus]|uniref:T cell receptor alpha chain MC.7.G5-like n=1 Tax=Acanthochromis polyacanthus TaxID=80966 RepID=UPI002234D780|nr:T cell receptor alpha chain MC.7.G5-like [Acanthochromis polyacanthus]
MTSHTIDILQPRVCQSEEVFAEQQFCNQKKESSLDQEDPESTQIKEEQEDSDTTQIKVEREELCSSPEEDDAESPQMKEEHLGLCANLEQEDQDSPQMKEEQEEFWTNLDQEDLHPLCIKDEREEQYSNLNQEDLHPVCIKDEHEEQCSNLEEEDIHPLCIKDEHEEQCSSLDQEDPDAPQVKDEQEEICIECKGEDKVMQPSGDVIAAEGDTVTLDCTFETSSNTRTLFWYKQEVNGFPKYILRRGYSGADNAPEFHKYKFDAELNKTSVPLKIQKLHLSDSAVYYCALRPTSVTRSGTDKLIFGSGTKLIVGSKEEYDPYYYKLQEGDTTVCLATGFSRYNATTDHEDYGKLFNDTEAARISPDLSLYNQVIFPKDKNDKLENCEASGTESGPCEDTLTPDPTVNGMSLTILALRVIFLKTVVCNILMTMRLWISQ